MKRKTRMRWEAKAKIIKAMAHPVRLFIVDQLFQKSRCVCELTEMIGADTSTVSKHLSVLKAAGIVSGRKQGLQVHYTLKVPCIIDFFGCVEKVQRRSVKEQMALIGRR